MNHHYQLTTDCDGCSTEEEKWMILHNIRHKGIFRRLCTSCVLKSHPGYFCPICFQLYSNPHSSIPNNCVKCLKCPSVVHLNCVNNNGSGSNYVCPPCLNPNYSFFDVGNKRIGCKSSGSRSNGVVYNCDGNEGKRIDVNVARVLVAASKIASISMGKAAIGKRIEAENRLKEAALARKVAIEALELFAVADDNEKGKNSAKDSMTSAIDGMEEKSVKTNNVVGDAVADDKRSRNKMKTDRKEDKSVKVKVNLNNLGFSENVVDKNEKGMMMSSMDRKEKKPMHINNVVGDAVVADKRSHKKYKGNRKEGESGKVKEFSNNLACSENVVDKNGKDVMMYYSIDGKEKKPSNINNVVGYAVVADKRSHKKYKGNRKEVELGKVKEFSNDLACSENVMVKNGKDVMMYYSIDGKEKKPLNINDVVGDSVVANKRSHKKYKGNRKEVELGKLKEFSNNLACSENVVDKNGKDVMMYYSIDGKEKKPLNINNVVGDAAVANKRSHKKYKGNRKEGESGKVKEFSNDLACSENVVDKNGKDVMMYSIDEKEKKSVKLDNVVGDAAVVEHKRSHKKLKAGRKEDRLGKVKLSFNNVGSSENEGKSQESLSSIMKKLKKDLPNEQEDSLKVQNRDGKKSIKLTN